MPTSISPATKFPARRPVGYLSLTINAHLPWVIHHGAWPHGMEWLLEAAAETYLPLLRVFENLQRDEIPFRCNVVLSPVLLEQLGHPLFREELPRYLQRKIDAAKEDEAYFTSTAALNYAAIARHWQHEFTQTLQQFNALDGDLIAAFRSHQESGLIEIFSTAATYGYLPLLGSEDGLRAQVRLAVETHTRYFGRAPRGFWLPECGYRPAGRWEFPVANNAGADSFHRIGVEQVLAENGIEYFFTDAHLIAGATRQTSPTAVRNSAQPIDIELESLQSLTERALYQPYFVDSPSLALGLPPVTVFARDPLTQPLLWSAERGYPSHVDALDYHNKRWPGGHRYWRITGANLPHEARELYDPKLAASVAADAADDFLRHVEQALAPGLHAGVPPVLTALVDADLLGRWWHEGAHWLERLAHALAARSEGTALAIAPITAGEYLRRHPRAGYLQIAEGSWGAYGNHHAWLNTETRWMWEQLYPAESLMREIAAGGEWERSPVAARIAAQLGRELLLMQSSDWQFLIFTGAARDYAHSRFTTHGIYFEELLGLWELALLDELSEDQLKRLGEIESRDELFPELGPALWSPAE